MKVVFTSKSKFPLPSLLGGTDFFFFAGIHSSSPFLPAPWLRGLQIGPFFFFPPCHSHWMHIFGRLLSLQSSFSNVIHLFFLSRHTVDRPLPFRQVFRPLSSRREGLFRPEGRDISPLLSRGGRVLADRFLFLPDDGACELPVEPPSFFSVPFFRIKGAFSFGASLTPLLLPHAFKRPISGR